MREASVLYLSGLVANLKVVRINSDKMITIIFLKQMITIIKMYLDYIDDWALVVLGLRFRRWSTPSFTAASTDHRRYDVRILAFSFCRRVACLVLHGDPHPGCHSPRFYPGRTCRGWRSGPQSRRPSRPRACRPCPFLSLVDCTVEARYVLLALPAMASAAAWKALAPGGESAYGCNAMALVDCHKKYSV
jgi:hypothetical protein